MKTDRTTIRAMVIIELATKESITSYKGSVFSSLILYKIFKQQYKLSDSVFNSVMRFLKAFEVFTVGYGERTLSEPKWGLLKKNFPEEYKLALKEIEGK